MDLLRANNYLLINGNIYIPILFYSAKYLHYKTLNLRYYDKLQIYIVGHSPNPLREEVIFTIIQMLKLEDFKIKEIDTLESITGGLGQPSIWFTKTYANILGFIVETGGKADSCRSCDNVSIE